MLNLFCKKNKNLPVKLGFWTLISSWISGRLFSMKAEEFSSKNQYILEAHRFIHDQEVNLLNVFC